MSGSWFCFTSVRGMVHLNTIIWFYIRREYWCVFAQDKIWNIGSNNQWIRFSFTSSRACDYNHIHATLGFSVRIMVLFHKCEKNFSSQHITRVLHQKKYLLSTTELFLGLIKIELSHVLCIKHRIDFLSNLT